MTCVFGEPVVIFDQIISAFKIDNKIIEINRTTHKKTYNDLIQCTMIPRTTEICFIDNSFFPKMCGEQVYYIQPRSYIHYLRTDEIIDRFISSNLFKNAQYSDKCFESILYEEFQNKECFADMILLEKRLETDLLISQKLMYYIREFFYLYSRKIKTRKVRKKLGRFTIKKRK
jgi:hypothetical protein